MRKYNSAPRPFIFRNPTRQASDVQEGDKITFGLTLVGDAVRWLPQFVLALQVLGEMGLGKDRVNFVLEEVIRSSNGEQLFIEGQGSVSVPMEQERLVAAACDPSVDHMTLDFISPLRIKYDGQLAGEMPFHVLARNLLRRTSLLSYFHCKQDLELDFKGIIAAAQSVSIAEASLAWREWGRRSTRTGQDMKLGGLVGTITYHGALAQFRPLVTVGEVLHVGKAVSFGFGQYRTGEERTG